MRAAVAVLALCAALAAGERLGLRRRNAADEGAAAAALQPADECAGGQCAELQGAVAQNQADLAMSKDHQEALVDDAANLHAEIPSLLSSVKQLSAAQLARDSQLKKIHADLTSMHASSRGVDAARDGVAKILGNVDHLSESAQELHSSVSSLMANVQRLTSVRKVIDAATGATGAPAATGTVEEPAEEPAAATGPAPEPKPEPKRCDTPDCQQWKALLRQQLNDLAGRVREEQLAASEVVQRVLGQHLASVSESDDVEVQAALEALHSVRASFDKMAKSFEDEFGEAVEAPKLEDRTGDYAAMAREVVTTDEDLQWRKFKEEESAARRVYEEDAKAVRAKGLEQAYSATGGSPYPNALGHRSATGANGVIFQTDGGYTRTVAEAETGNAGIAVGGDTDSPDAPPGPAAEDDDGLPTRKWAEATAPTGGSNNRGMGAVQMPEPDVVPEPEAEVRDDEPEARVALPEAATGTTGATGAHEGAATATADLDDVNEPDEEEMRITAEHALEDLMAESKGIEDRREQQLREQEREEQRNLERDAAAKGGDENCATRDQGRPEETAEQKSASAERDVSAVSRRERAVVASLEERRDAAEAKGRYRDAESAVDGAIASVSTKALGDLAADRERVDSAARDMRRVSDKRYRIPAEPAATGSYASGFVSSGTARRLLQAADPAATPAAAADPAAAPAADPAAAPAAPAAAPAAAGAAETGGAGSGLLTKEQMAAKMADNTEVHERVQEAAESGVDTDALVADANAEAQGVKEVAGQTAEQFSTAADAAAERAMDEVMKDRKENVSKAAAKLGATGATGGQEAGATGGEGDGNGKLASSMLSAAGDALVGGDEGDEAAPAEEADEEADAEDKDAGAEADAEADAEDKDAGAEADAEADAEDKDAGAETENKEAETEGKEAESEDGEADAKAEEEAEPSPEAEAEAEHPEEAPEPETPAAEEPVEEEEEEADPFPAATGGAGISSSTGLSGAEESAMEPARPTDGESLEGSFQDAHPDSDPAIEDVFGSDSGHVLDSYINRNLRGRKYRSAATGGAAEGTSASGTVSGTDEGSASQETKVVVDTQVGTSPTGAAAAESLPDMSEVNAGLTRLETENAALEKLRAAEKSWAPLELPDMTSVSDDQARRVVGALQTSLAARVASAKQVLQDAELAQTEANIKAQALFNEYLAAPAAKREAKLALKRRANSAHRDAIVLDTYLTLVKQREQVEVKVADTLRVNGDVSPQAARGMLEKARKILDTLDESRLGVRMEPLA